MNERKKNRWWTSMLWFLSGLAVEGSYDLISSNPFLSGIKRLATWVWTLLISEAIIQVWVMAILVVMSITGLAFITHRNWYIIISWFGESRHALKRTPIGKYTFQDLYEQLKSEHIYSQTNKMIENNFDASRNSVVEWFIGYYDLLEIGIRPNFPQNEDFAYELLCPKLHNYGLVSKETTKHNWSGPVEFEYMRNRNGKTFMDIINQLGLPAELKEERARMKKLKVLR